MTQTSYAGLADRVVLITGGASGIGAAFVRAFAAQQARVAFLDIDADAGEALVREVAGACGSAPLFVPCDLLDIDALRAAMAQVHAALGDAAVLVNNAANDQRQVLSEVTPDRIRLDDRRQPQARLLRRASGGAADAGARRRFDHQHVVDRMDARRAGAAGLRRGEGGDRRLHQLAGPAGRTRPHSRQRHCARHGDHRAPAPALVPGRAEDR